MYRINPFFEEKIKFDRFVAPDDFNPDAQELNIIKAFNDFDNENKKYVFSVGNYASTTLPSVSGRSYFYKQNDDAYTLISSGVITWTSGSTKRHVIVVDIGETVIAAAIDGSIWMFIGNKVVSIVSSDISSIKYIHCSDIKSINYLKDWAFVNTTGLLGTLNIPPVTSLSRSVFERGGFSDIVFPSSLISIGQGTFYGCTNFNKTLNLPMSLTSIGYEAFKHCPNIKNLVIPSSVNIIEIRAFEYCLSLVTIYNSKTAPQAIDSTVFNSVNKSIPLHVPIGSKSAYQAAAGWSEFTNIIEDL